MRGRARGRGAAAPANAGPVGAANPAAAGGGGNGRGRGRGRGQPPPVDQMAALNVGNAAPQQQLQQRQPGVRNVNMILRPDNVTDTRGAGGQPISMLSNYFEIRVKEFQPFYQYHVTFKPPLDNLKLRKALVYNLPQLQGRLIFDGNLMYLPIKTEGTTEYNTQTRQGEDVVISTLLTNEVPQQSDQFIQVANIILNEIASRHMDLDRIRRDYYNPRKSIVIPQHKIELWPGYEFTVRRYSAGILLGLDVKHKILRTDTVLDQMNAIMQRKGGGAGQTEIQRSLVGQIVMTKYNNKTYRIDDVDFNTKASDSQQLKNGPITFIDYYKNNYDIPIRDHNQPILVHRARTKDPQGEVQERIIKLVPEVCFMTGLTDIMRKDYKIMQDLAQHTRQDPTTREKSLRGFRETIDESEPASQLLETWGLTIAKDLLEVPGRKLQPEEILIGGGGKFPCDPKREAFDNITRKKFVITTANIQDKYTVICTHRDIAAANNFVDLAGKVGPACGINIANRANVVTISTDRAQDYIAAIQNNAEGSKIVVCIVPNDKKDRYDAIKKHCCIQQPIPSQVLVSKNLLPKKAMSVVTKVVMQMDAKLGGELWSIHIPVKNVMYVGIDTYHDSGSNRSVGAFVASMNDLCTRYYSKTTWQASKQELISQLDTCMRCALEKYKKKNGQYPARIIIFRDGVGEGQMLAVKETEIKPIKDSLARLNVQAELIFTVVTKRIQARFFLKAGSRLANPSPGTFIDSGVTRDELFDFFLVPQSVGQGTVTPTHYSVLEFSTTLKPQHLQIMAYKLCHIYYNWTGTIRVPAVCQYAHKLAFLVGQSLHRDPDPQLAHLLYYL